MQAASIGHKQPIIAAAKYSQSLSNGAQQQQIADLLIEPKSIYFIESQPTFAAGERMQ
jgi:hypothetical protein